MQKEQAQERCERIRAFQAELKTLEREKVLTLSEDQRRRLAEYHYKLINSLPGQCEIGATSDKK